MVQWRRCSCLPVCWMSPAFPHFRQQVVWFWICQARRKRIEEEAQAMCPRILRRFFARLPLFYSQSKTLSRPNAEAPKLQNAGLHDMTVASWHLGTDHWFLTKTGVLEFSIKGTITAIIARFCVLFDDTIFTGPASRLRMRESCRPGSTPTMLLETVLLYHCQNE